MSFSAFEIADFGQFALPTSFFFLNVFFLRELLFYMQFSRCLVGSSGLEPPTSRLSGVRSNQLSYEPSYFALPVMLPSPILSNGGGKRIRTDDPLLAKQVLYQLSYTPVVQPAFTLSRCFLSALKTIQLLPTNSKLPSRHATRTRSVVVYSLERR